MTEPYEASIPLEERCERHPRDGFQLAEPVAVSRATERAILGLVFALLPPPPAPRPVGVEERIARHVRVMLQYMPIGVRLGFILLLRLLDWSPMWRFKRFARLCDLPPARGSEILKGIATSRFMLLRLMMLGPKAVVLSTYFDQDEVHAVLDYEPKGFLRERIVRHESLLRVIDANEPALHAEVAE